MLPLLVFLFFPELPQSEHISVADATWLALNVVSGGGNASNSQPIGVTKIAKSVIAPLADHNISVFMLSTYQTDFILVSADNSVSVLVLYHVKRLCTIFKYLQFMESHYGSSQQFARMIEGFPEIKGLKRGISMKQCMLMTF